MMFKHLARWICNLFDPPRRGSTKYFVLHLTARQVRIAIKGLALARDQWDMMARDLESTAYARAEHGLNVDQVQGLLDLLSGLE